MRIDQTNYESFLLSYIDGELTDTERQEVEAFCAGHPEAERELAMLSQTVLIPARTVFENKASLYREEEKRYAIGWYFRRAAVVLLLLGGTAMLYRGLRPASRIKEDREKTATTKPANKIQPVPGLDSGNNFLSRDASVPRDSRISDQVVSRKNAKKTAEPLPEKGTNTAKRNLAPRRQKTGVGGNDNPFSAGEDEFALVAPAKQLAVATVRATSAMADNPVDALPDRVAGHRMEPVLLKPATGHQIAMAGGPADAEAPPTGDDAVSFLPLTGSNAMVGKLFHRLTRQKQNRTENIGERKVNISIFQFAVGK